MEKFAVCTYRNQREKVEALLSAPVVDPYPSNVAKLARHDCLESGELRFDARTFRGSLFAVMYRQRFKQLVSDFRAAPAIDYGMSPDVEYNLEMAFADCIVRADPTASDAVVRGGPATPEEAAALSKLMPAMSGCVSKGRSTKLHKTALRGFIAESLYKLSVASSNGAAK
jgi:hypothetical protein